MAQFFIQRPIFAWVVSLLIMLAGILSLGQLPIAQYPTIAPPQISLRTVYPGASAKVLEEAVTSVIEKEMNGAPGLLYMSGTSNSNGSMEMALTFRQGTDPDIAAVEVQNRLKIVESRLPESVRREGVFIEKAANNIQLLIALSSDKYNGTELGELASSRIMPEIKRVFGVGRVEHFGSEQSMRIWPNPEKMEALGITPSDIVNSVNQQSARIIIGDIGGAAVAPDAPINANVIAEDPISTVKEFENISLRTKIDGATVRLKDIARIELAAQDYNFFSKLNGKAATGLAIKLAPGSNAVETTRLIREKMDELQLTLPEGVQYSIPYETSHFVEISIQKVVTTLIEAIVLVFLVMFLFLQNFRATLIPTLVVPVALLGTFAVMWGLGYSINMLTMFGMVLSIGILVDDAIVVVENAERIMSEEGLPPKEATKKAMGQISGAIVGITAVLISVFIPMAFFGGAVGNIYRQFSLTLVISIAFSAFLALSLTPALCGSFLKPVEAGHHHEKTGFFGWFNRSVTRSTNKYGNVVGGILRRPLRSLFVYFLFTLGAVYLYTLMPSSFLPDEDQGNIMVCIALPAGSLQEDTRARAAEIEKYILENEPVEYVYTVGGFSFFGSGPNTGIFFIGLKNWKERPHQDQSAEAIVNRINMAYGMDKRMTIMALNMPSLPELGSNAGLDLRLLNKGDLSYDEFVQARDQFLGEANQPPKDTLKTSPIAMAYYTGQPDIPQIRIKIDREKAHAMGVSMSEIGNSLAIMFGSSYVGDFMLGNQVRRILVQSDPLHRTQNTDIGRLYVRNNTNQLLPLSSFVSAEWTAGPPQLARYNSYPSFSINGNAAPGRSTGEAMKAMEDIIAGLPQGIGYEWTGQSYEEKQSGSQASVLFALSILIVFLVLAALYESWSIPLSVILVVPLGLLGALLAIFLREMPNDIYFKVGLITTIGLSAKNAILIVEVAKDLYHEGMTVYQAAIEASRLRLRPILMTSLAFGVGVLPLAFASGAAAGAQTAVGTGVLGGIITATILAIFFVPVFFYVIIKLTRKRPVKIQPTPELLSPQEEPTA